MATVVVGIGKLGLALARRFESLRPGSVLAVDLDEDRRAAWQGLVGQQAFSDVAEVPWKDVERLVVVVRGEENVAAVLRQGGAAATGRPVRAYVCSTVSPGFAAQLGGFCRDGYPVVELPVTGGEVGALHGTMVGMGAGPYTDEDVAFLTRTILKRFVPFRGYGQPAYAKLLSNAVIGYQVAVICELAAIARRQGIDPTRFVEVVAHGAARSAVSEDLIGFRAAPLIEDFELLESAIGALPKVAPALLVEQHRRLVALLGGSDL